jgi:hypothetical protein
VSERSNMMSNMNILEIVLFLYVVALFVVVLTVVFRGTTGVEFECECGEDLATFRYPDRYHRKFCQNCGRYWIIQPENQTKITDWTETIND